jgi:hypothetical protein
MNPTVSQGVVDEATELDPASARSEYGAEFRTDSRDLPGARTDRERGGSLHTRVAESIGAIQFDRDSP